MLIEALHPWSSVIVQLATEQKRELAALEGASHVWHPVRDGVAYLAGFVAGRPVGCGAVQPLGDGVGEIKRMYVRPAHRGRGYARLILAALEELAVERGYHTLRLETGRRLAAAVGLYQGAGYHPIPLYGQYVGSPRSACYEKLLVPAEV